MKMFKGFNIPAVAESIKLMGKHSRLFLLCIFLFCFIELAGIPLMTYGTKGVINAVTIKSCSLFWTSLALILIKHVVWSVYSPISSYLCDYTSKGAVRDIKVKTAGHIIKLPQKIHDSKPDGELLSYISNDTAALQNIYDWSFFQVIRHALQGMGGIVMMVIVDWKFAIVVFVLGTANVYITSYFSRQMEKISEKLQESITRNTMDAYELIKAAKTIRLLNLFHIKKSDFYNTTEAEAAERIKNGKMSSEMKAVSSGLSAITYLAILAVGAVFVYYRLSDWGTIIALTALKDSTDCLFSECGQHMAAMQTDITGVKRLLSLLNEEEETLSHGDKFIIKENSVPLKCCKINFSYDGNTPVIKDFDISIEPWRLTALTGESGCGKSTLMKLLLAIYEPDSGRIYFKGNEKATLEALRHKTAYVPQEPMLFSGSVYENILCGRSSASRDEVIAAAEAADAHEFIQALPDGYDTMILEDGKSLSGGQKQRIAIARALLKNSPVLLLDEITAFLDSTAEKKIMKTISKLSRTKAVLIITHKPEVAAYADRVYELDKII